MIIFLSVKVFPRRRLPLELACLPSSANPRASSFKSLPQHRDFNAQHSRTITFKCIPSDGITLSCSPIAAEGGVTLHLLVTSALSQVCRPGMCMLRTAHLVVTGRLGWNRAGMKRCSVRWSPEDRLAYFLPMSPSPSPRCCCMPLASATATLW